MLKKIALTGLLLVIVALALTACSTATPAPAPTPTPAVPTPPPAAPTLVPTVAPPTVPPPPTDDLGLVEQSGKLLVGTSLDNPPYSLYDEDFQPDGLDIAIMTEVAQRLGLEVEFNDFAFEGVLGALQLGQVDAAIAAITVTQDRAAIVDFSEPYWIGSDAVIGSPDTKIPPVSKLADLANKKVGVQSGSVYETYITRNLIEPGLMPSRNLFVYARLDEAVRDLDAEQIDLVLLDRAPAMNLEKQGLAKVLGSSQQPQAFAVAVRKGSTLLPAINGVLQELSADGTLTDLIEQYLQIPADIIEDNATSIPTPTPFPTPVATPTPAPCIDGMAYVADLNYDDRNMTAPPQMKPGQQFEKGWRIKNAGNCDWAADYVFAYASGNTPAAQMGGQNQVIGKAVKPGETIDIFVKLTAPQAPGTYQGFWQMENAQGTPFGERVWVGIRVPAPPTPPPPPTPVPDTSIQFSVDRTNINQGQCVTFTWNVTNVRAVYFYPQGQPYQQYGVAGQGSKQECPQATTTYELRVEKQNGQVVTQAITIYVTPVSGAPVIAQFSSSPEWEVVVGQCLQLWWDVQGEVSRVALVRNGTPLWDYAPVRASRDDCPPGPGTVTYELQAWGPGGFVKTQRSINVRPGSQPPTPVPPPQGQPEIRRLSATETTTVGACVWVSWEFGANVVYARLIKNNQLYADNAQTATNIAAFSGNPNGDCDTGAPGTIVYRLEAFNSGGQTTAAEARTNVVGAQPK